MAAPAAMILIKERHVAEAFESARATSPDRAVSPQEINVDEGGIGWRRLRNRAIVREASPGRFYLDVEVRVATRRMRRQRISIVLAVALIISLVFGVLATSRAVQ